MPALRFWIAAVAFGVLLRAQAPEGDAARGEAIYLGKAIAKAAIG